VKAQRFRATAREGGRGRVFVPVPFDPDEVWRAKTRHPVSGTVNGLPARGVIEVHGGEWGFLIGPAWRRDRGIEVGDALTLVLSPEGPQREDLAEDVAAALDANPEAGTFFDSLAQFYRRAYLRWVDGTKRRPDLREQRIAEMVRLLAAGVKQRPQ